ncbi:hypothetical protein EV175_007646, partial [Coemansia sp. RSA 1933]
MVAFAVGGLLGDVFLHLMPHMFADHDHTDHADSHTRNTVYGCTVFLGLIVFFVVDKFMRLLGSPEHSHNHGHSHSHTHARKPSKTSSDDGSDPGSKQRLRKRHSKKTKHAASDASEADDEKEAIDSIIAEQDRKPIKLSAYLNL